MRIIGTTKVTKGSKISLIKDVKEKIDAEVGDKIVYLEDEDGQIVVEKA